ncbi:MAG TPA: hypothetical protein VG497_30605 [Kribbella sp.]|nr:hypothetical protein [Kribbella sp.]
MIADLHEAYTINEVADAKKVSVGYIRRLVRERKVTPFRTSGPRSPMRFGPQHLEQIEKAMTPAPPVEPATRRRRRRRT